MKSQSELWAILGKSLDKGKTYIDNPQAAPKGANIQQGPRGGYYYEDVPSESEEKLNMSEFKNKLNEMDYTELKNTAKELEEYEDFGGWYSQTSHKMIELDGVVSSIFNLDLKDSRSDKKIDVSNTRKERITKLYLANQEILKRKHPSGFVTLFRGVNGKTKDKFNDFKIGDKVPLDCYNISSWSEDEVVANTFSEGHDSGVTLSVKVPIKSVLQVYDGSQFAYSREKEYILMGSEVDANIEKYYEKEKPKIPTSAEVEEFFASFGM